MTTIDAIHRVRQIALHAGHIDDVAAAALKGRLMDECSVSFDIVGQIDWFLARAKYEGASPAIVTICDGERLSGVVFLFERKTLGVPTGIYTSPYQCGFGSYLGHADHRLRDAHDAAVFLSSRLQTVHLEIRILASATDPAGSDAIRGPRARGTRSRADKGSVFRLGQTTDETFARFSHKRRRNLRYFARKAEQNHGCRFMPHLSEAQALDAVTVLNARSSRQMGHHRALFRCRATRALTGAFSVGLVDRDGGWLSYATGWRAEGICYLDWQLNREDTNQISFSAVMRSKLVEAEIARGTQALYLLGGSNSTWENACDKHGIQIIQMERTGAIMHVSKRLVVFTAKHRPIARVRRLFNAILSST